jgi:hypothetical protein
MVRIIAGCLLLTVGSVVLMTNSQEFRNLYGEPDLERYIARPGISVTIEYGSDHLPCNAMIEPPQRLGYTQEQVPLIPSDTVTEVLEEIVPVATRGKELNAILTQSGCNKVHMTDYENVFIMRSTHTCDSLSHDQDARTIITFKRDICPKPETAFTVTRP